MRTNTVKVKYLDTSAIVKLFVEEEGCNQFREYFNSNTSFCTTLMTYYEAFNVIKARLFKNQTKDIYRKAANDLAIYGWGKQIEIEAIELNDIGIFNKVKEISEIYGLDIADGIQIYAILSGKYSSMVRESSSVLITADDNLLKAANQKGIRVWNCAKEKLPEYLIN
jgi:predicted nucleic acid-binding protein